jgi:hypothetical protein
MTTYQTFVELKAINELLLCLLLPLDLLVLLRHLLRPRL